ncbi:MULTISPECIES: ArsR/SmtB family transcription factor [unclassified Rhodococcus (in: high G+C Gram-positive bacteria)]|uniref:ArsR/SmtB family transcription factor n=1 Tax=unclassified Rhodococcus (in: high G+C Gram-positive bacteria) TaxID=192944 RepID=UPI00146A3549|nr:MULTISPECIES: metalloregulator ArsR/SmtB family transcription factor [unclassified Rhodococcus (in: high G+C Gram-positive bacteria)]MBF0663465.1 winged helix-turn-helix transcriptional regulator [Rhodococcus sp. (in: high G+C Gram-positive bacteria)]NME78287.1 winged helix-turn-helix transcriptional regulator [Rhodococcus sp. 105337]
MPHSKTGTFDDGGSDAGTVTDPTRVFAALADDTRWQLLQRLARSPASASGLAGEFTVSRQAIAKHLSILEDCGLVTSERVGRELRFSAAGSRLSAVGRALEAVGSGWDRRLDAIKKAAERSV